MKATDILATPVCVLGACAIAAGPAVTIEDGTVRDLPAHGAQGVRDTRVTLPRAWMTATDVLVAANRQAGLLYVIVPAEFDAPVGPFQPGASVKVEDLAGRLAEATGTRLQWINHVAVFDPPAAAKNASKPAEPPPADVSALDAQGDSAAVAPLTRLAGSEDGSVRIQALAALQRMEGDFIRGAYPGRLSILEVLSDKIDHQALLCALEHSALGGRAWNLAAELCGRARERVLARHLWNDVWQKTDGVMEVGLWALGRCGDPSGGWAMRSRIRETFTNDSAHRYLAALALGQLNGSSYLERDRSSPDLSLRRATAFGYGFCRADNDKALHHLLDFLDDPDSSVRFVACQSLARLGAKAGVDTLTALAADGKAASDLRAAALDALVSMGRPEATEAVLARATDADATVRAQAAERMADIGASRAAAALAKLAGDSDRRVRAAAVYSLARLGAEDGIARAATVLADSKSDNDERIAAILGLGRSLAPAAAEPLARVAADKTAPARLRHYAVIGLARLANRAGQKHLALLANRDADNHLPIAIRHLELETPRATAEFLIPLLTHGSRDDACSAAGRLAEIGYGPGVVELLEGSDIFDNHTRMMHMWGTVRARGRAVTLALVEAAGSRRTRIRQTAAHALGGRLYPEAVDALIRLAHDSAPHVRAAAAVSLGVTPDPKAAGVLIELATKDDNLTVALHAARGLRLRDYRHLPQVREAFQQLIGTPRDPGGIDPDPPTLADQPTNSFVLRAWADLPEEDLVCNLTYESSMCYDAHRRRIVQWGAHGRRYDTPQTGLTWFFDPATARWTKLTDSRHWPNGTCCIRGTMYDNANQCVISPRSGGGNGHGWHNALRANLTHSSPWILDVKTDQWYPASPLEAESGGGFMPGSHDPVHGVTLWWKDRLLVFDVYANRWSHLRPQGATPDCPGDTGGVFDPKTGRFLAIADRATWAFDPAKNGWTDLKPSGDLPPPCPMVYDSANDVMLAFQVRNGQVGVWVYHIRDNRWERLPAVNPCPARGGIVDVAYDEKNNVAVIHGTHAFGFSASLNVRETWTYRYKPAPAAPPALRSPRDVVCVPDDDGSVDITWTPAGGAPVAKYRIERAETELPWTAKWEPAGEVDGKLTAFKDRPAQKALFFYRVLAVGVDGAVARPSLPARTAPRIVKQVTAVVRPEGGIRVRWAPTGEKGVAGYNVYRAAVDLGSPWNKRFSPESVAGSIQKVTEQPVAGPEWVDAGAQVTGSADELTWPKTFAYVVKPVNAWGIEGGASPVTLALPDPPGPAEVVPWADGRRLVLWNTCLSGGVTGYTLMRMDDWTAQSAFRQHAAPLPCPAFWDGDNFPTHDRRLYHASGLDALGTIGIPTSEAWSHGFP